MPELVHRPKLTTVSAVTYEWLVRLIAWDGILPVAIWLTPYVFRFFLPGWRGPIEIIAVVFPIAAIFLRTYTGFQHISTNNCGHRVKGLQLGAFFLCLLAMFVLDVISILSHVMPQPVITFEDIMIMFSIYALYLFVMAFVMYPGFQQRSDALGLDNAPYGSTAVNSVPFVTRDHVVRIARREFPAHDCERILDILETYGREPGNPERHRVHIAILKLSDRNIDRLRQYVERAMFDYRDVILPAESPRFWKIGFVGVDVLPSQAVEQMLRDDWNDYFSWINSTTA